VKKFAPTDVVPQDRLLELMDLNKQLGTGQFAYVKSWKDLRYTTHLDTRAPTPSDLRRELISFVTVLEENQSPWNFPAEIR
jgi:hypothetical protein